jgi:transcriptional regulator with XRE-family HTH domain
MSELSAVNEKLIAARKQKCWSQEKAAAEIKIDRKTYVRWEQGQHTPQPGTLDLACKAFDMSPQDLGFGHSIKRDGLQQQDELQPSPSEIITLTKEQVNLLSSLLQGDNIVDNTKREALRHMLTVAGIALATPLKLGSTEAWERLAYTSTKGTSLALNASALEHFERLLCESWELSNSNELEVAESVLSSFLPKLLVLSPRETTMRIAYLASQGLRLQSVLVHHRLQITEKILMCEKSVEYARYANDANTLVATLVELAVAYKYNGHMEKWFKTIQEALYYVTQASPLLQSQAYFKSALAFAYHKRQKEADLYFQMGFAAFPDHPERDPGYALADSNIYTFSRDAGRARLEMGQISDAYSTFEMYKQNSSNLLIPERLRLEIINGQSRAAILENDLDKYAYFVRDGLAGAVALGSKKRFDEASTTFRQEMPVAWRNNSEIQSIAEHYHLMRA